MALTPVERFLLAHLLYEYGGRVYFTAGREPPEVALAGFLAEDFVPADDQRYQRVKSAFADALRGLRDKWMVELRGFEVVLTYAGRAEAQKLTREQYNRLREKFARA